MLCQRHDRSHRGFKKKSSNSTITITEAAKGGIDPVPVAPKAQTAQAASRPAAAQPRPGSDKETVVKKSSKLISLDNIHEHTNKKKEAEEEEAGPAPMIREFNEENVLAIWNEFAASIRETKGGASVLMEAIQPIVTDATITINFASDLQKSKFNEVFISFKTYIYRRIGFNPHIIVEVTQTTMATAKLWTPKDKLERLMEINPALRRFQKELGLDLDYD